VSVVRNATVHDLLWIEQVPFYHIARRQVPEYSNIRENLKSDPVTVSPFL
jgi:hypothetical protein